MRASLLWSRLRVVDTHGKPTTAAPQRDEGYQEYDEGYQEYLRKLERIGTTAFSRTCTRRSKLKRKLECGHWIDGSEPYRYHVSKCYGDAELTQRRDCEFCARVDLRG